VTAGVVVGLTWVIGGFTEEGEGEAIFVAGIGVVIGDVDGVGGIGICFVSGTGATEEISGGGGACWQAVKSNPIIAVPVNRAMNTLFFVPIGSPPLFGSNTVWLYCWYLSVTREQLYAQYNKHPMFVQW